MPRSKVKTQAAEPPKAGAAEPPVDQDGPLDTTTELFLLEYIANGRNGRRAWMATHPGVKPNAADACASRALSRAKVRDRLKVLMRDTYERLQMAGDEATAMLALNARADIRELFDENGKPLPPHKWPNHIALCVKAIKPGPFGDQVILHDQMKARELLAIDAGRIRRRIDVDAPDLWELLGDEELED